MTTEQYIRRRNAHSASWICAILRSMCGASGFLRKQHPLGNVITEWFSTCAARWYLCNSSSCGAEREGVGKPQRVQVAWKMLDWQRRGEAGHASWNILATTVTLGQEVRQLWCVRLRRNQYRLCSKSHAICDKLLIGRDKVKLATAL